jgi:uncharacterized delta-60 repeat protein
MKKVILILAYLVFQSSYTHAQQAGTLDVSFGGTGTVSTSISPGMSGGYTAIQPDGKIIIGGSYSVYNPGFPPAPGSYVSYFAFARYNQNGTLDNTFGTNGVATINIGSTLLGSGYLNGLSLQVDGKIVAVGSNVNAKGIILRLNTNGTLDNTFDSDGIKEITTIGAYSIYNGFNDLAIQPNGKIIVVGTALSGANRDFCVIRLNTDGSFDLGFDGDGVQTTDFIVNDFPNSVRVQLDGKIVVAGDNSTDIVLARYTTAGALDTSFDSDGKLTISIPNQDFNANIVFQTDGKIVVGCASNTGLYYFSLIRLNTDGSLDLSFDSDGFVTTNFSGDAYIEELALQPDGKIIALGRNFGIVYVVRYNPNGSLDTSFNLTGIYTSSTLFSSGYSRSGILQVDGKLLIGGVDGSNYRLARFHGVSNFNSNNGKMITQIGTSADIANAVAIRPNGKIITGGYSFNATTNNDFTLIGYNADGSLDYTFGNNAIIKTDIATNSNDQIKAISILPDGKIIVVGESTSGTNKNIVVAKYLADGSGLDPTFSVSGIRIVTFASSLNVTVNTIAVHFSGLIFVGGSIINGTNTDFMLARFSSTGSYLGNVITNIVTGYNVAYSLAIQPDSKILLAGQSDGNFAVARYNIGTLALDNTFGTGGKVTTTFGATTYEEVRSVAIQIDGKIVVSGNTDVNGTDDFAVIRYNINGSLDNTFGTGGKVIVSMSASSGDLYPFMSLHTSGKIVLAGLAGFGTIGICRLNTNGTLDTGFDGDGKMTFDIGYGTDQVNAVALQTDGKMILAGSYNNGANDDFALVRVNGINDFSVNNGRMIASIGLYDNQVNSILVQTDGKIILAGQTSASAVLGNSFDSAFGLIRFNADGSLDNTFDGDGKIKTQIGNIDEGNYALALQSDGKIIAAGGSFNGVDYDFALVRYNTNGSLDGLFGTGGKKTTAIGTADDNISALAIQPADGKIIAAGNTFSNTTNYDCALFRYNSDGTTDNTFGTSGKVITSIATTSDNINSIVLQNDGKIVAVGRVKVGSFYKILVLRYSTTGVLDNSFDADGILQITTSALNDYGISVDIQADGKIILGGYTSNGTDNDFVVIRLNTDGTFDNTFNGNGKLIIPIGTGDDFLNYLKILPNGKILATGSAFNTTSNDVAIVRINSNGVLDTSFDADGKYTTPIGSQGDKAYGIASINSVVYVGGSYNANTNYDYFLQKLPLCAIETPVLVNSADNYPNVALPNPVIGKSITATNFVLNPSNVTYQVKEKIDFLPGFKAENVTLFKTDIVGCSY